MALEPDVAMIERTLRLLHPQPKALFEIRAVDIPMKGTRGGYYLNTEISKAVEAVVRLVDLGAPAVYVTLNDIKPACHLRSPGKLKSFKKSDGTEDADIIRRRWLPIDLDADNGRPTGVSSTDDEHRAALEKALIVREELIKECDFPDLIYADSGNGAHLLGALDLPNDPDTTKLIANFLKVLAKRYTDKFVKLDTSVSNAARLWKIYGTPVRKGSPDDEHPHRLAQLLEVPK
jgi:hypothetical protein